MNLNKSQDYFDPDNIDKPCHIIGCGAIGSCTAELLARAGITDITLWDFDTVESHNMSNQLFYEKHVGTLKTEALSELLIDINPLLKNTLKLEKKWEDDHLEGYIFLCVDNIDVRRDFVNFEFKSMDISFVTDMRMGLVDGQLYSAIWDLEQDKKNLLASMQFTHKEAKEATPVSACGFELSVAPTVRFITALGISNFVNYVNTGERWKMALTNSFNGFTEVY